MKVNSILALSRAGWVRETDDVAIAADGFAIEAFLSLGSESSESSTRSQAQSELARLKQTREEITVSIDPSGGDLPLADFDVGDTVGVLEATERVVTLTVSEDEDGDLVYAPQLRQVIPTHSERVRRTLERFSPGTMGGDSRLASPAFLRNNETPTAQTAADAGGGTVGIFSAEIGDDGEIDMAVGPSFTSVPFPEHQWNVGVVEGLVAPYSYSVETPGLWHVNVNMHVDVDWDAEGSLYASLRFYRDGDSFSETLDNDYVEFAAGGTTASTGRYVLKLAGDVMFESTADFIYVTINNYSTSVCLVKGSYFGSDGPSRLTMHLVTPTVIPAEYGPPS